MIRGRILDLREDGTAVIEAPVDIGQFIHRKVKEVYIELVDSRPLSDRQRRMCYALIKAIADWAGSDAEEVKETFKLDFWAERVDTLADKIFSLADAPMSLVAEFQRFLVAFILTHDVPTKFPLREYVDDIEAYTYFSVVRRKCAVCGRKYVKLIRLSEPGDGYLGAEVMSLCGGHEAELRESGRAEFFAKYHLDGGIECDKTILKIYGLKR